MAMEMVCGNCQGRLMVEQTGVVVACPHCGAHLQIGEAPPPPIYQPQPDYSQQQYPPQNYPYPHYPQQYPQYPAPQDPTQPSAQQPFPPQQPYPPQHYSPQPNYSSPAAQSDQIATHSAPIPETRRPELSQVDVTKFDPHSVPPAPAPAMKLEVPPVMPQTPGPAASSQLGETIDFTLPPALAAAAKPGAESDTWLPKIDLSMPEPIRPGASDTAPQLEPAASSAPVGSPDFSIPSISLQPPPKIITEAPPPVVVSKSPPTEIWNSSQVPSVELSAPVVFTSATPSPAVSQPAPAPNPGIARDTQQLPDFSNFGTQSSSNVPAAAIPTLEISAGQDDLALAETTAAPQFSQGPAITTSNEPRPAVVSKQLFIIVASYASAVTLGFIYLWLKTMNGSALDLPDRKLDIRKGQVGISIYPDGPLPTSHRLKLGQSKQFGSLRVTPIKVTKGPLEFVHHQGDSKFTRPPSFSPVLKLWLRFENVSSDQTFPALDEDLVYTKFKDRTNNYLCLEKDRIPKGKKITVYDWPANSEWLMKGQELDTELHPGETWETYIPTNDERDIDSLQGPLAWRVHFRKGYNRTSFRGVTTIVEVEFDSKDIQADS